MGNGFIKHWNIARLSRCTGGGMTPTVTDILTTGTLGVMGPSILRSYRLENRSWPSGQNGRLVQPFSPPPSGQAPSIKTSYKSNVEAVFPARSAQRPKFAGFQTRAAGSRNCRRAMVQLGAQTIIPSLPQGARAKAHSSPPAPFNFLMQPLDYREFHYLRTGCQIEVSLL